LEFASWRGGKGGERNEKSNTAPQNKQESHGEAGGSVPGGRRGEIRRENFRFRAVAPGPFWRGPKSSSLALLTPEGCSCRAGCHRRRAGAAGADVQAEGPAAGELQRKGKSLEGCLDHSTAVLRKTLLRGMDVLKGCAPIACFKWCRSRPGASRIADASVPRPLVRPRRPRRTQSASRTRTGVCAPASTPWSWTMLR
jgi:hypothetical protein